MKEEERECMYVCMYVLYFWIRFPPSFELYLLTYTHTHIHHKQIEFPKTLTDEQKTKLREVLG